MIKQKNTLERVFDHALHSGFETTWSREDAVRTLSEGINPEISPTYRSGKVGGWRSVFTDIHKRLFKDITGDLLIRLEYEQDADW